MRICIIFLALLVAGCVTSAGTKLSQEEKADCRGENPSVVVMGFASCLEYGRVKPMRGVYYSGLEESRFVAGDSRINSKPANHDLPSYDPWLSVDDDAVLGRTGNPQRVPGCARAFYLEFDGRESLRRVPEHESHRFKVVMVEQLREAKFLGYVRAMNTELKTECPSGRP
ncbi:hypothetical protein [Sphingomonas xanthus]|uniref:Lipoprotein n=1 Tax=Sphingomonas xanthus TaxID=2594473 RepID=A0A516IQ43_9SPHN|nr:hypothetical protein [Sphingomonas xanthus]QDP19031.1 hypothetical protein FMM02_03085 [Sphingomonas xanthus]